MKFRINKTNEIIDKNDRAASERQRTSLEGISMAVNTLKETVEEKKFSKGEEEEDIQAWAKEIEDVLGEADRCMTELTKQITGIDRELRDANAFHEHKQAIEKARYELSTTTTSAIEQSR